VLPLGKVENKNLTQLSEITGDYYLGRRYPAFELGANVTVAFQAGEEDAMAVWC